MGIALSIIVIALVVLFVLGRGAAKTTADIVVTGEKVVKATPVVAAKATAVSQKAAVATGHAAKVSTVKTADVTKAVGRVTKATALQTKAAAKKGWQGYRESLREELAKAHSTDAVDDGPIIINHRERRVQASKSA